MGGSTMSAKGVTDRQTDKAGPVRCFFLFTVKRE